MSLLKLFETRSNPPVGVNTPGISESRFLELIFNHGSTVFAGETVDEATAMGVTAVWQAVNMIASTMASMPLHLYRDTPAGRVKADNNPLYKILHDQVNKKTKLTSYQWRKQMMSRLLLSGRAYSQIETTKGGQVVGIYYMNPEWVTPRLLADGLTKVYDYQQPNGGKVTYDADEIIDLVWMPTANGVDHYNPIQRLGRAIGLTIAAERYAGSTFENGGVPPFAIEGPIATAAGADLASQAFSSAVNNSNREKRNAIVMPAGHKIIPLGFDAMKTQLLEARKFQVTEICRIFNVHPSLLMDMSAGTFNNVEQQDLSFSKHCVHHWTELWEQELNCKLMSDSNKTLTVEFNLDGLQRGDFDSRMTGYATGLMNGFFVINEVRAKENLPPVEGGDKPLVQGGMVSLQDAMSGHPFASSVSNAPLIPADPVANSVAA